MKQEIWHDSLEEALRTVVQALGGPKAVGRSLYGPAKDPQDAARLINKCLDADRPEKFSLAEVVFLLREGCRVGAHDGMNFLTDTCFYERSKPTTKQARRDDLKRQLLERLDGIEALRKQLERE